MDESFLKLTSSAYRLSEYFPESDPLKDKVKEKILAIMENLVVINQGENLEFSEIYPLALRQKETSENIEMLLGYFEVAKNQEWISPINYLIISNQYKKIREEIKEIKNNSERIQEIKFEAFDPVKKDIKIKAEKLSSRQQKIIDFLKQKEKAQVMDLQTILPDITKRTIRRDLDQLLETGEIIRMGEFNQVFYKIS